MPISQTTRAFNIRLIFRTEHKHGLTLRSNGPQQSVTINLPKLTRTQRRQKIAKGIARHLRLTKAEGWRVEFGRVIGCPSVPVFMKGRDRIFAPRFFSTTKVRKALP